MGLVVALLTSLIEPLSASVDGPTTLTAAVLAVALAALVRTEHRWVPVVHGPAGAVASVRRRPVPVLTGRVTDPVHHPLRPRAPGIG